MNQRLHYRYAMSLTYGVHFALLSFQLMHTSEKPCVYSSILIIGELHSQTLGCTKSSFMNNMHIKQRIYTCKRAHIKDSSMLYSIKLHFLQV